MKCCDYGPWGCINKTSLLCNLQISPKSQGVYLWQNFPAYRDETLNFIEHIQKLKKKKMKCCEYGPWGCN